jgi:hypothetical protein
LFSASNPIYGNKDIYVVYKNNIRSHLVSFYNIKDKYGNQTLLSDETQKYYINYGSNVPQEVLAELNGKLIHPDYPNDYIPAGGNNYYENWDSAPVYITGPKSFTAKYIFNSYYSTKLINKEIVEYTVPITISTIGSKAFYQC